MKKMDEMELRITQKGIKWSWIFMVLALATWGICNLVKTQSKSLPLTFVKVFFKGIIKKPVEN